MNKEIEFKEQLEELILDFNTDVDIFNGLTVSFKENTMECFEEKFVLRLEGKMPRRISGTNFYVRDYEEGYRLLKAISHTIFLLYWESKELKEELKIEPTS